MTTDTEIGMERLGELTLSATRHVFDLMVGEVHLEAEEAVARPELHPFDGVVALVTFTGDWVGAGMLCFDETLACIVGSKMLMTEVEKVDADVLDGVGELANMILGSIKEGLEERTGPLSLSVPTVVYGKNFLARPGVHAPWVSRSFRSGERSLEVWVSIQPL